MVHHQLTHRERYLIGQHESSGERVRSIARMLHRSPCALRPRRTRQSCGRSGALEGEPELARGGGYFLAMNQATSALAWP